jgi:perosamine synthetase
MIPVYQPYFTGKEKQYVNECIDKTWISSKGEFISRFETQFADYIGVNHATTVCNGTVALHLGMAALGLKAGDEVIVPTLTYVASVNAIVQTGATPVFVDCLDSTWQMDHFEIERKLSPKTKAIMAVHLYGLPCDMSAIARIARDYNLFLIEDCAEGLGSRYKGQHVGTFGDIATFSFYGNKTITTGEGGMVVSKDESIARKVYHLKTQAVSPVKEYWHDVLGYNYRMTNICAAIGVAQLESVDEILAKKRQVAKWYEAKLSGLPLRTHEEPENLHHSYWMCSVLVEDPAKRDSLRVALQKAGVETRPFFYPVHILPHHLTRETFPVAERLSNCGLNLPSWPGLTESQVDHICVAIRTFYDNIASNYSSSLEGVLVK